MTNTQLPAEGILKTYMSRYLFSLFGVLLAFPVIVVVIVAFHTPITVSGFVYLLGSAITAAGLIFAPLKRRIHLAVTFSGLSLILIVALVRLALAGSTTSASNLKMVELPSRNGTRWVNYLFDEQDTVLFGEAALRRMGGVSPQEHNHIASAMQKAYSELRATQRVFPSPFASTYLGLQNPSSFDAVVIEPKDEQLAKAGVIFLHGYMGNVTAQCWRIAQAVEDLGLVTVCPSTDWIGDWWTPRGEAILRATFDYLHEQGIQTIYLGGFSNGGIGTSRLAPKLATEENISGLFMIAGVTNTTKIIDTNLPVLVIQGTQDERMPASAARQFAEELGDLATYVEIESDHFVIMKQSALVQEAIRDWLQGQATKKNGLH